MLPFSDCCTLSVPTAEPAMPPPMACTTRLTTSAVRKTVLNHLPESQLLSRATCSMMMPPAQYSAAEKKVGPMMRQQILRARRRSGSS